VEPEGERLIPDMLALHKPKRITFALDCWWFNQARAILAGARKPLDRQFKYTFERLKNGKAYNFQDGTALGSPDCALADGRHGGFVTYIRMPRTMAPDLDSVPSLRGRVRPLADLDRLIATNSGRATLGDEAWSGPEVDFLGLGCRKWGLGGG
jgi:hypothetical protein